MRRVLGAVAAFVAVAVALSGCSLIEDGEHVFGDVQRGFVAQQRLDQLTTELRARNDIITVEASAVPVYQTANVAVLMDDGAAPEAIADVVTLVDEALRSTELQPMTREFEVTAGNASIRQADFELAAIDYPAELDYWAAVNSAVGSKMSLTLGPDLRGSLQRVLGAKEDETVVAMAAHFDALSVLEPPNGAETSWMLPGISGATEWPLQERTILTFLAAMAGLTNLLDESAAEEPPGVYVFFSAARANYPPQFTFVAPTSANLIDVAAHRQLGLAMAREALMTGLPSMGIAIQTFGHQVHEDPYLHVGECLDLVPPTAADRKFVADLVASGVDLPDTAAGHCIVFANP